jgi:imidazoleglycerol phosphate synthase glutamine amidotransferase subunit HisH
MISVILPGYFVVYLKLPEMGWHTYCIESEAPILVGRSLQLQVYFVSLQMSWLSIQYS